MKTVSGTKNLPSTWKIARKMSGVNKSEIVENLNKILQDSSKASGKALIKTLIQCVYGRKCESETGIQKAYADINGVLLKNFKDISVSDVEELSRQLTHLITKSGWSSGLAVGFTRFLNCEDKLGRMSPPLVQHLINEVMSDFQHSSPELARYLENNGIKIANRKVLVNKSDYGKVLGSGEVGTAYLNIENNCVIKEFKELDKKKFEEYNSIANYVYKTFNDKDYNAHKAALDPQRVARYWNEIMETLGHPDYARAMVVYDITNPNNKYLSTPYIEEVHPAVQLSEDQKERLLQELERKLSDYGYAISDLRSPGNTKIIQNKTTRKLEAIPCKFGLAYRLNADRQNSLYSKYMTANLKSAIKAKQDEYNAEFEEFHTSTSKSLLSKSLSPSPASLSYAKSIVELEEIYARKVLEKRAAIEAYKKRNKL